MERLRAKFAAFEYKGLAAIALVFAVMAALLFVERSGIRYQYDTRSLTLLPAESAPSKAEALADMPKDCLVLYNSKRADSRMALEEFEVILTDMKVGHDTVDLSRGGAWSFKGYKTAVLLLSNLSDLGDKLIELDTWVYEGGGALLPMTLSKEPYFSVMEPKFGIVESSYDFALADGIYVTENFMVGGGRGFAIIESWDSALVVRVDESDRVKVHAYTDDDRRLPLVWESRYGSGRFVLDNLGIYTKNTRGIYAASYSLLTPVTAYPVINASCFYLDDFPSQIPSGSNEYVWRDYGTSTRDFYVNIWWPDMMNLADRYGLAYTGLAIQCYDDRVDGTTTSAPDKETFLNFGNMLLRMGGEIGYHGYNHQPLCLDDCDYNGVYDYKTWQSEDAMASALDTLLDLCDELFPGVEMSVYVPPSNIMSEGGQAFLILEYPQIRSISGIYFESADLDFYCTQEFDVLESGVVAQPRIISGCDMDDFMKLAALSELNFHYVNSHFTHPDDSLDPERGAQLGWEELKSRFTEYLDWLYTAAPNIRNFTGSEMAAAVQRFAGVTVSTEATGDTFKIRLGNFTDEAWLMVRFNDAAPQEVEGGALEQLTDTLYLLRADQPDVTVTLA